MGKMSTKRKVAACSASGQGEAKRYRQSSQEQNGEDEEGVRPVYQATSAKLDPESGQRGVFPGLDEKYDEAQLFYGPASDGLEYLRMVRSEAKAVPKLLVATSPTLKQERDDSVHQHRNEKGLFTGGAYIGEAEYGVQYEPDELDVQEAYSRALITRFRKLRLALNCAPLSFSKPNVGLENAINADVFRTTSRRAQWQYCFRQTLPTARCLAMASQEDVIRAVSRLEALITKRNLLDEVAGRNISAWLWSLLAKCREVGQMGSDHISVLRGLAKTAMAVGYRTKHGSEDMESLFNTSSFVEIRGDEANRLRTIENEESSQPSSIGTDYVITGQFRPLFDNGVEDGEDEIEQLKKSKEIDSTESRDDQLEKSKQALIERLSRLSEKDPSDLVEYLTNDQQNLEESVQKALAVVDIVVTLVGEVFGQRDLLGRRDVW